MLQIWKLGPYRTMCPCLNIYHKKKDKKIYKMKGKHAKGHRAYISWEEDDENSSSSSGSSYDDECDNLWFMVHKKSEDFEVYTFNPKVKPSYKKLSKDFSEMHAYALSVFKKISLQIKLISKLEKEINDLNSSLDSLKGEHAYLVDERFNTSNTLVKNIVKIDCVTCPILKIENKNLKGQLAQTITLFTTSSMSSNERGVSFKKNPRLARRNRKSIPSKAICYVCDSKGHIRTL